MSSEPHLVVITITITGILECCHCYDLPPVKVEPPILRHCTLLTGHLAIISLEGVNPNLFLSWPCGAAAPRPILRNIGVDTSSSEMIAALTEGSSGLPWDDTTLTGSRYETMTALKTHVNVTMITQDVTHWTWRGKMIQMKGKKGSK